MSVILASAGYDHVIRFWSATSGHCLSQLEFKDSQVNRLSITTDKQFLAAAGNPSVKLFDIPSNTPEPIRSFEGHTGNVTAVNFQRETKWMYTSSEDGSVRIWDIRAPGCQRLYECQNPVNSVHLHPNQASVVTAEQGGSISLWDLIYDKKVTSRQPDSNKIPLRDCAISTDAAVVVCGNNRGDVYLYDLNDSYSMNLITKIEAHSTYCLKTVISPDCKSLCTSAADSSVKIWDLKAALSPQRDEKNTLSKVLRGHQKYVWDCAFSADSAYLVTGASDRTLKLWEIASGNPVVEYKGHQKAVTSIALNDSPSH